MDIALQILPACLRECSASRLSSRIFVWPISCMWGGMSIGTAISAVPATSTASAAAGATSGCGTAAPASTSAVPTSDSSGPASVSGTRTISAGQGSADCGAGKAASGSFSAALAGASASSSQHAAGNASQSPSSTTDAKSASDPHAHHGNGNGTSSAALMRDRTASPPGAAYANAQGMAPVATEHGKAPNKSGHHDLARATAAPSSGQAQQAQAVQTSQPPPVSAGLPAQASAALAVQALSSHQVADIAPQSDSHAPVVPGLARQVTPATDAKAQSVPVEGSAGSPGSATTGSSSQLAASSGSTTSGVPHSTIDSLAREAIGRLQSAAGGQAHHTAAAGPSSSATAHASAETRISATSANSTVARQVQPAMSSAGPAPVVSISSSAVPALPGGGETNGAASSASSNSVSGQIAAALVGVSQIQPPQGSSSATPGTRLTIALAPPAIGTVTLQIDRHADGSLTVAIGASHADTLQQLQNDRNTLNQVLTQAGLPDTHRTVTFDLIAPHADASGSHQASVGAGANGFGGGFSLAGGGPNGGSSGSEGSGRLPVYVRSPAAAAGIASAVDTVSSVPAVTLRRFGVNVVA